jgi:hypothetical protein
MRNRSILRYDPHRVDDAWDIAEDRQKDVYPELLANSHLQEHPQRRENNRSHDTPKIHRNLLSQDPDRIRCRRITSPKPAAGAPDRTPANAMRQRSLGWLLPTAVRTYLASLVRVDRIHKLVVHPLQTYSPKHGHSTRPCHKRRQGQACYPALSYHRFISPFYSRGEGRAAGARHWAFSLPHSLHA